jgi:uncharacterized protein YjbI with pentapeptide repeats
VPAGARDQTGTGPGGEDDATWRRHWRAAAQPWRTEPAIDDERARELDDRHREGGDGRRCAYDLTGLELTRADVEWLVADHPGRPCGEALQLVGAILTRLDLSELPLSGADLRGADLEGANLQRAVLRGADLTGARLAGAECQQARMEDANLEGANLEGAGLMWAHLERAQLAHAHLQRASLPDAHLEGADLLEAHLEDAYLGGVYLSGANLLGAHLERSRLLWGRLDSTGLAGTELRGAALWRADLRGANLAGAHLEGTDLTEAHLEGANLAGARLHGTNLTRAHFDGATNLEGVVVGGEGGGMVLADTHWNGVNLAVFDWSQLDALGDEKLAHAADQGQGPMIPVEAWRTAARASQQVALELRARGINEQADRFSYRAQVLQRRALRREGLPALGRYLFSLLLWLLCGYGYRPGRSLASYILVIVGFMLCYRAIGPSLGLSEALVVSITAFHGRGFFPGAFSPGDPLALVSAFEAFIGLVIEVILIATITQRLFGK